MFKCQDCGKEFEYTKKVQISIDGIRCEECHKIWGDKILDNAQKRKYKCFKFKPFFDQSLGLYIDSYSHKKEIEKIYNVEYMSNNERIAVTKEAKINIENKNKAKYRKGVIEVMDNVHRGYSYIEKMKKER